MARAEPETLSSNVELETLLQQLNAQQQLLQSQASDISMLLKCVEAIESKLIPSQADDAAAISLRRWKTEILQCSISDPASAPLLQSFSEPDSLAFEDLFSPMRRWTSHAFHLAHPALSRFLRAASPTETSNVQMKCVESYEDNSISKWPVIRSKDATLNMRKAWAAVGTRVGGIRVRQLFQKKQKKQHPSSSPASPSPTDMNSKKARTVALTRDLKISDVSPLLAAMVLESSPPIHQELVSLFLERYLSYTSWAQVSVWAKRSITCNSFVFEYHIPCYYISSAAYTSSQPTPRDSRGVRRTAPFGPIHQGGPPLRRIHEEQLSLIIVGVGRDVYTSYQLGENYFLSLPSAMTDPSHDLNYNVKQVTSSASTLFLSWLRLAFHHLDWRWKRALEAVSEHTDTSSHIVFSGENIDLLSDDHQFSRSRTYFWALQVYKMYDEQLSATIQTWKEFKQDRLYQVDDGRLPPGHWEFCIGYVESVVKSLEARLAECRAKTAAVHHLREGLFGASSLFDSRTAVRQGDNIRLLTYITLLFLPLSFGASVFGMQVVLPNLPLRVFGIALPCIFVGTALLIFNLQTIIDTGERIGSFAMRRMRSLMYKQHRAEWKVTAQLLDHERLTRHSPVKRVGRKVSHWVYVWFLFEWLFVQMPVAEVNWAMSLLVNTWRSRLPKPEAEDEEEAYSVEGGRIGSDSGDPDPNGSSPTLKKRRQMEQGDKDDDASLAEHPIAVTSVTEVTASSLAKSTTSSYRSCLGACFRVILLALWVPVVAIEYLVTLFCCALSLCSPSSRNRSSSGAVRVGIFTRAAKWLGLDVQ